MEMQHFRVCGPSWLQTVSVRIFETLEVAFGPPGDAGWNSDPVQCPPIANKWRKVKSELGFKTVLLRTLQLVINEGEAGWAWKPGPPLDGSWSWKAPCPSCPAPREVARPAP